MKTALWEIVLNYMDLVEKICFLYAVFHVAVTRSKKRWGIAICSLVLFALFLLAVPENMPIWLQMVELGFVLIAYAMLVVAEKRKYVIYYILAYGVCGICNLLGVYAVAQGLRKEPFDMLDNDPLWIFFDAFFCVVFFLMGYFSKRKEVGRGQKLLWYYSIVVFFVIVLISSYLYPEINDIPSKAVVVTKISLVGLVIILVQNMITVLALLDRSKKDKERIQIQQELLVTQKRYYKEIIDKQTEIRKIRHDMKAHFLQIDALCKKGNIEEIQKYLQELDSEWFMSRRTELNVGNLTANVIVNYFASLFDMEYIQFSCHGMFTRDIKMTEYHICSLFYNLLENAYEACMREQEKSERFAELRIEHFKDYLMITVSNSCYQNKDTKGGTSKPDTENHGFGLQIIREVVKEYGGDIKIDRDSDKWKIQILFGDIYEGM